MNIRVFKVNADIEAKMGKARSSMQVVGEEEKRGEERREDERSRS